MRVLVTGGAGFIGSHCVDALIQRGHSVYILDDLSSGKEKNIHKKAIFTKLDITQPTLSPMVRSIRPQAVFHFAAQSEVSKSTQDPIRDAEVNSMASLRLIEASQKIGVKRFIFASSAAVYGETFTRPTREDHPTRPVSPYGISKLSVEYYLSYYHNTYHFSYAALRFSNVYGPRQNSKGEAGVVAIFCDSLPSGKKIIINGNGKQTRDYIYVKDAIEACMKALSEKVSGVFNVSTTKESSVLSIVSALQKSAGIRGKVSHGPKRPGDLMRSSLDNGKARKTFAWKTEVSFAEGIERTVSFFQDLRHPLPRLKK